MTSNNIVRKLWNLCNVLRDGDINRHLLLWKSDRTVFGITFGSQKNTETNSVNTQ